MSPCFPLSPSIYCFQTVDDDAMEAWMWFGVARAERCPRVGVLKPPSWRTSHSAPTWWRSRVGRRWDQVTFITHTAHHADLIKPLGTVRRLSDTGLMKELLLYWLWPKFSPRDTHTHTHAMPSLLWTAVNAFNVLYILYLPWFLTKLMWLAVFTLSVHVWNFSWISSLTAERERWG